MTTVTERLHHVDVMPSVVTIGVFDGVHRGHRALLDRVRDEGRRRAMRSVAVTFDRHPMAIIDPDRRPVRLQSLDDKVAALAATGIDHVHVLRFDRGASREPADGFAARVLGGPLAARHVVVGSNFRFGHQALGDVALLAELGPGLGFTVEALDLVDLGDVTVSSSAIREALQRGDVAWAADALGRPHRLSGPVGRGDGRGRTIGVPTANVQVEPDVAIPAAGVYATRVRQLGAEGPVGPTWDAVTNIGTRPTFDGRDVTVEAHLLDVDVDLYDRRVVVDFVERLRDEQRFDDVDALVAQIHADIDRGRAILDPSWVEPSPTGTTDGTPDGTADGTPDVTPDGDEEVAFDDAAELDEPLGEVEDHIESSGEVEDHDEPSDEAEDRDEPSEAAEDHPDDDRGASLFE